MSVLERDESESEETLLVMRNRSKQVAVWHAPVLRIGISTTNYLIRYYVQMTHIVTRFLELRKGINGVRAPP
jgi:hypothetical protein